ncbi:hypothetical protein GCM10027346_12230 [Hymenobacter seoulensis]
MASVEARNEASELRPVSVKANTPEIPHIRRAKVRTNGTSVSKNYKLGSQLKRRLASTLQVKPFISHNPALL